ncbi:MAG: TIGR00266 family protein [Myxococcales bacterium]|nr:TIGR00266 family protein [Myxococcales bacterium]
MQHDIVHGPSHALMRVNLSPGETLIAEAGSMVTRSENVGMAVKLNSSKKAGFFGKMMAIFVAFIRKALGGDSFFVNHFSATGAEGNVTIAPALNGSIEHRTLGAGENLMLTQGCYLASTEGIDLQIKWGGCKGMLSKEGAFFVEASGPGELWFNSYGGIFPVQVNGTYIVDNGHIVAFDSNLTYTLKRAGKGMMGFLASGEGLVCEFQGQGTIYLQSRNIGALVGWLTKIS